MTLNYPITEDEVYHVLEGRGIIRVGEEDTPVSAGSTVFVAVGVEHRFHSHYRGLEAPGFLGAALAVPGQNHISPKRCLD